MVRVGCATRHDARADLRRLHDKRGGRRMCTPGAAPVRAFRLVAAARLEDRRSGHRVLRRRNVRSADLRGERPGTQDRSEAFRPRRGGASIDRAQRRCPRPPFRLRRNGIRRVQRDPRAVRDGLHGHQRRLQRDVRSDEQAWKHDGFSRSGRLPDTGRWRLESADPLRRMARAA